MATLKYRRIGAFLFWGAYQAMADFVIKTDIYGYSVNTKFIQLDPDGRLTLKKYFVWDGPTYAIKTRSFVVGSGVHDALCNLVNMGLLPMSEQCKIDEEMLKINRTQKMNPLRRAVTYLAVRGYQLNKKNPFSPKIHQATVPIPKNHGANA